MWEVVAPTGDNVSAPKSTATVTTGPLDLSGVTNTPLSGFDFSLLLLRSTPTVTTGPLDFSGVTNTPLSGFNFSGVLATLLCALNFSGVMTTLWSDVDVASTLDALELTVRGEPCAFASLTSAASVWSPVDKVTL